MTSQHVQILSNEPPHHQPSSLLCRCSKQLVHHGHEFLFRLLQAIIIVFSVLFCIFFNISAVITIYVFVVDLFLCRHGQPLETNHIQSEPSSDEPEGGPRARVVGAGGSSGAIQAGHSLDESDDGLRAGLVGAGGSSSPIQSGHSFDEPDDGLRAGIIGGGDSLKDLCPICLEDVMEGGCQRLLLDCRHIFHFECLEKWLVEVPSCPICRAPAGHSFDELEGGRRARVEEGRQRARVEEGGQRARVVEGGQRARVVERGQRVRRMEGRQRARVVEGRQRARVMEGGQRARVVEAEGSSRELCPICLEDVMGGGCQRLLPDCGHLFHFECVEHWLVRVPSCPLCRCPVRPPTSRLRQ